MSQAYRVKNTFAEFPESDDEEARPLPRSSSWSGSFSTPAQSSSNESTGTNPSPYRSSLVADIRYDTPSDVMRVQDEPSHAGHIVFDSDTYGSSTSSPGLMLESVNSVQKGQPEQHAIGACTPCLRFMLKDRCKRGDSCNFCHMSHTGEKLRQRPGKVAREQCKQLIQCILDSQHDREKRLDMLQALVEDQCPFTRSLVLHKIKDFAVPPVRHEVGQVDRAARPSEPPAVDDDDHMAPGASEMQVLPGLHLPQKVAAHCRRKAKIAEDLKALRQKAAAQQSAKVLAVGAQGSASSTPSMQQKSGPANNPLERGRAKLSL
eukprot:TRINITY_DN37247_c0_g1_i1.p1 TRINITY_DN37247_c0_g1~~TRINITY_DN37247_c0_g1_i1.p1  ORF type:complete len:332 (-),score=47.68 TRINITY_DN37247_c0_g1_i1:11-967(-)